MRRDSARLRNAVLVVCLAAGPLQAVRITEPVTGVQGVHGIVADRRSYIRFVRGDDFEWFDPRTVAPNADGTDAVALKEIAVAADGSVWGTEPGANKIWRLLPWNPAAYTSFTPPTPGSAPTGICAGPDGNIWFTEFGANKIGRITLSGTIVEFPIPTPNGQPNAIIVGPDGNLWFTEYEGNKIGRMTRNGVLLKEYDLPSAGAYPAGLVSSTERIYVTEPGVNKLAAFYYDEWSGFNFLMEADIPSPNSAPQKIVVGPDEALWFTEFLGNKIGRWDPGWPITEYPIPTPASQPYGLTAARNGDLWFTETATGKIGRVEISVPGDVNGDGHVDVSDVFHLINFLFASGPAPK